MHVALTDADRISALTAKNVTLTAEVNALTTKIETYRTLYENLLETCKRLEQGILAQKRERLTAEDSQLTLSLLGLLLGKENPSPPETKTHPVTAHERAKPTGRAPLPEHLPRIEIELLPPEVEAEGKEAFVQIGCEVSETLERRTASMVVVKTIRPKFVRKGQRAAERTRVFIAEPAELPIEKGLAGPSLLADTIVKRWQDHLPLYRQEQIYERDGVPLARGTMCQWHGEMALLCRPLVDAMVADALTAPYLCTDATGVLVQAEQRCRRSHFWVLVAPERHVIFSYSEKHTKEAAATLLKQYKGYVVADAATVYDHLFTDGTRIEVACWSHVRRYFFKAIATCPEQAKEGLAFIQELFRIERSCLTAPRKKRTAIRRSESQPIVDAFFFWCLALQETVVDESPIAKAVTYARNQEKALRRFLEDGDLPIHNNWSEGALRREAVGRKNWLFLGNDNGGQTNVTFVTLLASCQMHGIEPHAYLRDLFCVLPRWPVARVLELAPLHWLRTKETDDVKQRLEANIFRKAVIANT